MKALFLDVASNVGSLGLIQDDSVRGFREMDHRISDGDLIPLIEETLKTAGWTYSDLTHLACVIGPGGFTSLRVGIAFANALAWDKKIPLAGIHLSDLYFARVSPLPGPPPSGEGEAESFYWLHSTKKQEIFIRGFGTFAKEFPDACCVQVDSLKLENAGWAGELIPEHRERFKELTPLTPNPLGQVLPSFIKKLPFGTESLLPWYGRQW